MSAFLYPVRRKSVASGASLVVGGLILRLYDGLVLNCIGSAVLSVGVIVVIFALGCASRPPRNRAGDVSGPDQALKRI